ncbi:hypothetical protein PLICRDRAFT_34148 [Plicaturopsis crispa FD-325 SS-3]|nr:hypothetical protein PLICRDRAFT_34148 [Plicaturopsis crispa FD-325 SS-3]
MSSPSSSSLDLTLDRKRRISFDSRSIYSTTTSGYADSITSISTITSVSTTFAGIGSTAGRAIHALGKAQLRLAEALIVRSRLATISAAFPHNDNNDDSRRKMGRMYDDLLEFLRPEVYSSAIRHRAMRILVEQVSRHQTRHLMKALRRCGEELQQLFISEFMRALRGDGSWTTDPSSIALRDLTHTSSPLLLTFLTRLPLLSARAFWTLMSHRFLDLFLTVYVRPQDEWLPDPGVLHACNIALGACAERWEGAREAVEGHALSRLWPSRVPYFLRAPPYLLREEPEKGTRGLTGVTLERREAWGKVDQSVIRRRIRFLAMNEGLEERATRDVYDDYVDLLELARPGVYDEETAGEAGRLLERFLAKGCEDQLTLRGLYHADLVLAAREV